MKPHCDEMTRQISESATPLIFNAPVSHRVVVEPPRAFYGVVGKFGRTAGKE